MMRIINIFIFALGATLIANQAIAENSEANSSMPDRAELEAALEECFSSLETENNGRPDHSAIDSCMSAKGFSRPSAPLITANAGMGKATLPLTEKGIRNHSYLKRDRQMRFIQDNLNAA
jgi:hypothetical protein